MSWLTIADLRSYMTRKPSARRRITHRFTDEMSIRKHRRPVVALQSAATIQQYAQEIWTCERCRPV